MTVRLRPHHLLCILTYVGKGYSPAFTDNMTAIAGRLSAGEPVEIVEGPDDICTPRQSETNPHCHDCSIQVRDQKAAKDVGRILNISIENGTRLSLPPSSLMQLRRAFAQGRIRSACGDCQWGEMCTEISANAYHGALI
ncbi:DUF1284 domain-containing protein [Pseudosulfitobacter pseudonitzschiae]|uniref:DUF1284 domain-containing protein n=1 Tax=Pseudosulfitobacter pseudonitzschiae TaxID=1402135 RepID=UPI001AF887B0|nr:DUF1284 domain-containing protein [Pseudosulfitobacter pseudonitzschiae]MBM1814285.1 DUF1284 domain-containing protein [Pseudosulfitobacter pseudonitzschiae]MBM1831278.1 DUF1284 domain-containing protein [Pseudosulfitobacter pseudonitzschiae]MBM1836145.1 DUF1284 domain-containing protein [Pseudosulfitobacter pseudonitzschiae]MBM1840991.1 DUF1284 domain-containing protein [Pseudosulfitobacter pseudonitzschiae]MBM1845020.1 DUF1284 domain-containing protein [Pseudosulfitobacter pseudonitzschia